MFVKIANLGSNPAQDARDENLPVGLKVSERSLAQTLAPDTFLYSRISVPRVTQMLPFKSVTPSDLFFLIVTLLA
jgi:hypothetical protein